MRKTVLLAAIALPFAASAQQPVRDVAYFMAHQAEARATVAVCNNNAAYSHLPTCLNARQSVELTGINQRTQGMWPAGSIRKQQMSVEYWLANPIGRAGELAQCRRNGPYDGDAMPFCAAAAQAELRDLANRGR
jgi:hypothetical protein|nr:hypothetical protein [uncultured Rhodopila sp.]